MLFVKEVVGELVAREEAGMVLVVVGMGVAWTTYLKLHCDVNLWHTGYAQTTRGHLVHRKKVPVFALDLERHCCCDGHHHYCLA